MKEENLLCSFFYARAKERKELGLLGPPHSNLELAAALRTNQVLSLLRSCAYASRPCLLRRGPLYSVILRTLRPPAASPAPSTHQHQKPTFGRPHLLFCAIVRIAAFPFVPSPSSRPAFPTCCYAVLAPGATGLLGGSESSGQLPIRPSFPFQLQGRRHNYISASQLVGRTCRTPTPLLFSALWLSVLATPYLAGQ